MNDRNVLRAAGLFGAIGVGLGAFGAHGLREVLSARGMVDTWETATRYHLIHAVGLFCIAIWLRQKAGQRSWPFRWAARSWVIGILLFSGSLYGLALGGPRWLGPVTPLGGAAFIAGWILLIIAASVDKD